MNRRCKLILDVVMGMDIVMGIIVPVLVLNNFNGTGDTTLGYLIAAVIPVAWVVVDLFFVTKRFNIITTYVGASAVVHGVLVFWRVDGALFALKDSFGPVLTVLVFGGSLFVGKPIMFHFMSQAFHRRSRTPEFKELCAEKRVSRAMWDVTVLVLGMSALVGVATFIFNMSIVTADVGTVLFNQQVAEVRAVTWMYLRIPAAVGLLWALYRIYRVMRQEVLEKEEEDEDMCEPWDHRSSPRPGATHTMFAEWGDE